MIDPSATRIASTTIGCPNAAQILPGMQIMPRITVPRVTTQATVLIWATFTILFLGVIISSKDACAMVIARTAKKKRYCSTEANLLQP